MPYYESVLIARQEMSSAQVDTLADELTATLEERGGSVAKRENWGLRNLAYRIKKNRKGHYVMLHIDAPWSAVEEIERRMRLSEDVLRYMTIKIDSIPEGPSVMMQSRGRDDRRRERGDRDDRGERGDRREDRGERREDRSERRESASRDEESS